MSTPPQHQQQPSHPAHVLLSRAHSPTTAQEIHTSKILHKPLLLHPSNDNTPGVSTDSRSLRRHVRARRKSHHRRKQKPAPLSAREKRDSGIYDLEPGEARYEVFRGLNRLWTGYFWEVVGLCKDGREAAAEHRPVAGGATGNAQRRQGDGQLDRGGLAVIGAAAQGSLVASAEYQGMEVEVVRCRDVGRVGTKGIVVRETKSSFVLVGPGDKVRTVLKRGAVFRVEVELPGQREEEQEGVGEGDGGAKKKVVLELHGDRIEFSPVDRAMRKFKWKSMDYL